MEQTINAYKFLFGKPELSSNLGRSMGRFYLLVAYLTSLSVVQVI
jgi:hypothetical protein